MRSADGSATGYVLKVGGRVCIVLAVTALGLLLNSFSVATASPLQQYCGIYSWARGWQDFNHGTYPQVSGAASFVEWSSTYTPVIGANMTTDLHVELYDDESSTRFRGGLMMFKDSETGDPKRAFFAECWGLHCSSPVRRVQVAQWSLDTPYQVQIHVHADTSGARGDVAIFDNNWQLVFWTDTTDNTITQGWNSDTFYVGGFTGPQGSASGNFTTIGHGWLGQPRFVWCSNCPTWEPVRLLEPNVVTAPPPSWANRCGVHIEVGTNASCQGVAAGCYH